MWLITKILLFWCILINLLFWPTENLPYPWIFGLITCIPFTLYFKEWSSNKISVIGISIITLLLILKIIVTDDFILSISPTISYVIGIFILKLSNERKHDLLQTVVKWFSILTIISLSTYIIWLITNYPDFGILYKPFVYANHRNFITFVIPVYHADITRFSGPFIEPGHYSMFASFLLLASHFDLKNNKWLWPILLGVLFSLSLAGYVLVTLGYMFSRGFNWKQILSTIIIGCGIYWVATDAWNHGDNPLNDKIIERLQPDEEKGISGNNRNLYHTDIYFYKMVEDGSIINGIGSRKFMQLYEKKIIGGAGITIYLIINGVIGLILILLYYMVAPMISSNKNFMWKFFLFICICFLQRAYPLWIAWLLPYMAATRSYPIENNATSIKYKR